MDGVLWIMLPVLVAAGSAILSFFMMQARMEVAVAKEREALAKAHSDLEHHERSLEERVRAAEESAYRRAFDQFLLDFRVEERHYVRESKTHLYNRKSMVMQERLYFRNIPLSNWVEHELPLQEGGDNLQLPAADLSVFSARSLSDQSKSAPKYLAQ